MVEGRQTKRATTNLVALMKKSDLQRIESKEREWDLAIRASKRLFLKKWKPNSDKLKIEINKMINFIMFFKPKSARDKYWHIAEMIIIYVVLQYAWIGMKGW